MATIDDELSYAVIGLAMQTHREPGPGLEEAFYQKLIARRLARAANFDPADFRCALSHRFTACVCLDQVAEASARPERGALLRQLAYEPSRGAMLRAPKSRGSRRHAGDRCFHLRSAGWQPAVSRIGNPPTARKQ
jgi:hypothetical protein